MARKPLNGAVVGFGRVAELAHAPAWAKTREFRVVAAADSRPERLERAAGLFPGLRAYRSLAELLRKERGLDFADIASPPALHAGQVLACLRAGLHVLCEKPLGLSPAELSAVRAEAEARRRAVFCGHNWAHAPLLARAEGLVSSGLIGAVRHAALHVLRTRPAATAAPGNWRTDPKLSGGGILVDHGWHQLYLLHRLLGGEPRVLSARLRFGAAGVEEEASVFLEYPGAAAELFLTWNGAGRSNWGVVHGTRGSLELRDDHILLSRGGSSRRLDFQERLSGGSAHPEWFKAMLVEFKAELLRPSTRYRNLREAESCAAALAAAYRSHRLGGRRTAIAVPAARREEPSRSRAAAPQRLSEAALPRDNARAAAPQRLSEAALPRDNARAAAPQRLSEAGRSSTDIGSGISSPYGSVTLPRDKARAAAA